MSPDNGAEALAERLHATCPSELYGAIGPDCHEYAAAILGDHGLFLPDGISGDILHRGWNDIRGEIERLRRIEAAARTLVDADGSSSLWPIIALRAALEAKP